MILRAAGQGCLAAALQDNLATIQPLTHYTPHPKLALPLLLCPSGSHMSARRALLLALGGLLGCAPLPMLRVEALRVVEPLLEALGELPALATALKVAAGCGTWEVQVGPGFGRLGGGVGAWACQCPVLRGLQPGRGMETLTAH